MNVRRRVVLGLLPLLFVSLIAVGFGFWHAGYRGYVIHTGSMEPTLMPGDLIIDRPASTDLRPGEVVTFRHSAGPDLVTHRISDVTATGIHTKGDANRAADAWLIPPGFIQGSVQWQLPRLGYVVVFLQQPTGFAAVVLAIIGVVLLWGLFFPPAAPTIGSESESDAGEDPDADLAGGAILQVAPAAELDQDPGQDPGRYTDRRRPNESELVPVRIPA